MRLFCLQQPDGTDVDIISVVIVVSLVWIDAARSLSISISSWFLFFSRWNWISFFHFVKLSFDFSKCFSFCLLHLCVRLCLLATSNEILSICDFVGFCGAFHSLSFYFRISLSVCFVFCVLFIITSFSFVAYFSAFFLCSLLYWIKWGMRISVKQ